MQNCRQPRTSLLSILKGVDDDADEEVRKIQIAQKVGKDDVLETGPAIEIKLELPARNSASAVDDDEYEDEGQEEEEVIRIESIEVTTLDPSEVEQLKVSERIGRATSKMSLKLGKWGHAGFTQPLSPNSAICHFPIARRHLLGSAESGQQKRPPTISPTTTSSGLKAGEGRRP